MTPLEGAVAVITGGGSGIGRATAHSLARRGVHVVVTDVDEARATTVAEEVGGTGLRLDVRELADLERARDVALDVYDRVDIVMNNVGVLAVGLPEDIPLDEWQRIIDSNLMGLIRSNQVFLPVLTAQGHGHIVNTASVAAILAYTYDRLPYTATKAAVYAVSEAMRLYLEPQGVGVSCFAPAGVITNIVEQMRTFGPPRPPRPPKLPTVAADVCGEIVADGIEANRFLLVTSDEARAELARKNADPDAYLAEMITDLETA